MMEMVMKIQIDQSRCDASELVKIEKKIFSDSDNGFCLDVDDFDEAIDNPEKRLWIASDGKNNPVGYILIGPDNHRPGKMEIISIGVLPDYCLKGIGKELVEIARTWANNQYKNKITVTMEKAEDGQKAFFAKCGFDVKNAESIYCYFGCYKSKRSQLDTRDGLKAERFTGFLIPLKNSFTLNP